MQAATWPDAGLDAGGCEWDWKDNVRAELERLEEDKDRRQTTSL